MTVMFTSLLSELHADVDVIGTLLVELFTNNYFYVFIELFEIVLG